MIILLILMVSTLDKYDNSNDKEPRSGGQQPGRRPKGAVGLMITIMIIIRQIMITTMNIIMMQQ